MNAKTFMYKQAKETFILAPEDANIYTGRNVSLPDKVVTQNNNDHIIFCIYFKDKVIQLQRANKKMILQECM